MRSLRPPGTKVPSGSERELGQVSGMRLNRVGSPVDDEIGAVLDLAQGTRHLAHELGAYQGRAMGHRCVAVDDRTDFLGQHDGDLLRFGRRVAQAVHQRHVGAAQNFRGHFNRLVHRRRLAVDEGRRQRVVTSVIEEQLAAKLTGLLGRHDALMLGVKLDIVAKAAATHACGVLDYGSVHSPPAYQPLFVRFARPSEGTLRSRRTLPGRYD